MILYKNGNLFESNAQTLTNTVNCVGIMGKGIALEFKSRFPEMYRDYVSRCKNKQVQLGKPYLYKQSNPCVLNFPTKGHWKTQSDLQDIIHGLVFLENNYKDWGITSLAVPALGCSNGQLKWAVVKPIMQEYLEKFDILVEIFTPLN